MTFDHKYTVIDVGCGDDFTCIIACSKRNKLAYKILKERITKTTDTILN